MPLAKNLEKAGSLSGKRANSREEAVLNEGGVRVASVLWDFSEDGGATGTISLGRKLPANCIVTRCWTDEQTAVTGNSDLDLKAGSTDLVTAIDFTGDAGLQTRTLATAAGIKLSSESELKIDINTAAATAGKVRFFVEYITITD